MNENIRKEARKVNWQDYESILNFYETNQLYFDNYKLIKEEKNIVDIIQMKSRYIEALISKKRYTKALKTVEHNAFLLKEIDGESELYDKMNTDNMFQYGALNGWLKHYRLSYDTFSKLVKIDLENDLYKGWHSQLKTNLLYNKFRIVSYVGLALVLGDIICGLAFNYDFPRKIVLLGFILLLASWLLPQVMKYLNKRKG
jgi:hypothetical protein